METSKNHLSKGAWNYAESTLSEKYSLSKNFQYHVPTMTQVWYSMTKQHLIRNFHEVTKFMQAKHFTVNKHVSFLQTDSWTN